MSIKLLTIILSSILLLSCNRSNHPVQGYVEGENIYLASPYSGNLVNMAVVRGQRVKKGDLLFSLDKNPQNFLVKEALANEAQSRNKLEDLIKPKRPPEIAAIEAQIMQAEAQISLAKTRVLRNQTLFNRHVMDKDTLDAAEEHLKEVTALKAQYEANLAFAKLGARPDLISAQQDELNAFVMKKDKSNWDLAQKTSYAPDDGIIFDTYYKVGEFVNDGHPVLSLLSLKNTHIEFFIPLNVAKNLHVGEEISFTYTTSKELHPAKISYISPEAEYVPPLVYSRDNSDKIVFRAKADVTNMQFMFPGEPVIVYLESNHG